MTQSTKDNAKRCREFINRIQKLNAGDRARLKRNAGNLLQESRNVHTIYWRIRPYDLPDRLDDTFFLIATLCPFVADQESGINFGRTLKNIVTENNQNGLDRRFTALLDADEKQLPYRLRQLVMRLKGGDNKTLDWGKLLHDLTQWHHEDRYIQLRWARDYFTNKPTVSKTESVAH